MELRHWQFKAIWKSIGLAEKKFLAEILEQIHNFDWGLNKIPLPRKGRRWTVAYKTQIRNVVDD